METVGSSEAILFEFTVPSNGADVTVQVTNEANASVGTINVVGTAIVGGEYRYQVTIPATYNVAGTLNYRKVNFDYIDAESGSTINLVRDYVVIPNELVQFQNSFLPHALVRLQQVNLGIDVEQLQNASESEFISAMVSAYQRMKSLPIVFTIVRENPDLESAVGIESYSASEWGEVSEQELIKCARAQLIEANVILGGDPVGDRRRAGLLSDSSGESAQFFRSTRALDLAVSRQAIQELSGLLRWSYRTGR